MGERGAFYISCGNGRGAAGESKGVFARRNLWWAVKSLLFAEEEGISELPKFSVQFELSVWDRTKARREKAQMSPNNSCRFRKKAC